MNKAKFREFIENFWYYHKFKVFVAILVLIVAVNTVSQLRDREKPDYTVDIITASNDTDALGQELSQRLSAVINDVNGDGERLVHVNVYHYSIDSAGELSFAEDHGVHLAAEIQTASAQLFIADDSAVMEDTGLEELGTWGDFPLLMSISDGCVDYILYGQKNSAAALTDALR